MSQIEFNQPDLDWSQIRETIKLLTVSVVQVERSIKIGDESIGVLTDSFECMVKDMDAIYKILEELPASDHRESALNHCLATQNKINTAIIAFQFYDRLQQCLMHVSSGLMGLSNIIENPQRLFNPNEWNELKNSIRSHYTMEEEKLMFDAILQGKGIQEALNLAESMSKDQQNDDIELF
jgi:hypothetical protein